jgi:hypothetical protein
MPASRRLYVHIGLQKTGTTYLQAVMLGNRDRLASQGLALVPPTKKEAFQLMLAVRDRYQPGRDPAVVADALTRFESRLSRSSAPRMLLSQESLSAAKPAQVKRFLAACAGVDVHVVITVRDLARSVPSAWQQDLKAGRTPTYRRYLRRLQRMESKGAGGHPWIQLDPPAVLARWAAELPRDRIHVVTVPPSGAPPTLLLERFCRVIGVDPTGLTHTETPSNTSLGRVQAEVLRRVNRELPEELLWRQVYSGIGKRFFAGEVLADQSSRTIRVPGRLRPWCEVVSGRQVAALQAAGYHVEGKLSDLRCPDTAFTDEAEEPREREVATAAVTALARMLAIRAAGTRSSGPLLPRARSRGRTAVDRLRSLAGRG